MKGFTAFVAAMICTFSLLLSQDFGQITPNTVSGNSTLRLLTIDNKPVIKATDGKRYLANAKETFKYISATYQSKKLDLQGFIPPTPDISTNVYELVDDATYAQIFGSLSNDLDKLCLTQDQIEEFCLTHPDQLRAEPYPTLFLFKANADFFVAIVVVHSYGLVIIIDKFGINERKNSDYRQRVVVPQL